jgi:hypothetical protein
MKCLLSWLRKIVEDKIPFGIKYIHINRWK